MLTAMMLSISTGRHVWRSSKTSFFYFYLKIQTIKTFFGGN